MTINREELNDDTYRLLFPSLFILSFIFPSLFPTTYFFINRSSKIHVILFCLDIVRITNELQLRSRFSWIIIRLIALVTVEPYRCVRKVADFIATIVTQWLLRRNTVSTNVYYLYKYRNVIILKKKIYISALLLHRFSDNFDNFNTWSWFRLTVYCTYFFFHLKRVSVNAVNSRQVNSDVLYNFK